jgi:hypothetical protein
MTQNVEEGVKHSTTTGGKKKSKQKKDMLLFIKVDRAPQISRRTSPLAIGININRKWHT